MHCLAKVVRNSVIESCGPYWALMVDESKDVSRKEQLSFVIRSTTPDGSVWEKPLGAFHMTKVDAESLASAINDAVLKNKLLWNKCVAQCYDGASIMSGRLAGVQANIKAIAPQVIYIHCHAHRLNLVLVYTIKSIPEIATLFFLIQSIYVFLTVSGPRHELFVQAQKDDNLPVLELERLVETRWSYWYRSICKIKLRVTTIVDVLDTLSMQQSDRDAAAEAQGLRNRICSITFIRCLLVVEKLLGCVNALSEELQSRTIDYLSAVACIERTRNDLISFRTDVFWNSIAEEADTIGGKIGVLSNCDISRSQRRQTVTKKLSDYYVLSTTGKTEINSAENNQATMKTSVLFACIDRFVCELDARFTVNDGVLKGVAVFSPTSTDFLSPERVQDLVKLYPTSDIDWVVLDSQLRSAKSFIESQEAPVSTIHDVRSHLNRLPTGFSEAIKVIDLILTLPVTSVENERFSSCMK